MEADSPDAVPEGEGAQGDPEEAVAQQPNECKTQ